MPGRELPMLPHVRMRAVSIAAATMRSGNTTPRYCREAYPIWNLRGVLSPRTLRMTAMLTPPCRELPYPPECCAYINPLENLFVPGSHSIGTNRPRMAQSVRRNVRKCLRIAGAWNALGAEGRWFESSRPDQFSESFPWM